MSLPASYTWRDSPLLVFFTNKRNSQPLHGFTLKIHKFRFAPTNR